MRNLYTLKSFVWVFSCLLLVQTKAFSQVSISSLPFTYSQNFNTLPASGSSVWLDNTTLQGWYAQRSSNLPFTDLSASNGNEINVGVKSFGSSSTDTDRSLGIVGNTLATYHLGVRMKNVTATEIRNVLLSFNAKQWYDIKNKKTSLVVSYSKNSTSLTSGTWTTIDSLQATTTGFADRTESVNGNTAENIDYVGQYPLSGLTLLPGEEVYVRWTLVYDNGNNKEEDFAIDDVKIEAKNDLIFYSKPTGSLYTLGSWSSTPDYKGFVPTSFTAANLQFVITRNNAALTSVFNLDPSSKLIIGDGIATASLSIPDAFVPRGTVDVQDYGTLYINTNAVPTFGVLYPLSTIVYGTNATTEISTATYGNLEIKGGNVKSLKSRTVVRGHLKMSEGGKLDLGNHDLIMVDHKKFSAADANSYIQFKSSNKGRVRVRLKAGESTSIPVGTTSFTPISLALTAGVTDTFSVRVIDNAYNSFDSNDNPIGSPRLRSVVKKTWFIQEGVKGGSTMSVTLNWAPSDTLAGFNPDSTYLAHFENGVWDRGSSQRVIVRNGMYSIVREGFTSFSPFDVESGSAEVIANPLPVTLVSFTGKYSNSTGVTLNWATATEVNNDYFQVERSTDGKAFTAIGKVKGSGNSSMLLKYQFVDGQPMSGTVYYRLRQVDFDGKFEVSKVVAVNAQGGSMAVGIVKTYPNPTTGKVALEAGRGQGGTAVITVLNGNGQVVSKQEAMLIEGQPYELDLSQQKAGMLYLQVENGAGRSTCRIVKQ